MVSIIIVAYNCVNDIEKTIISCIKQSYKEKEIIIIDGGSKDGTIDIIKKYDHHIKYWRSEPDLGIYDGMNKGIKICNGDWIIFMNCGDIFFNEETLSSVFTSSTYSGYDIVYGDRISQFSFGSYLHKPESLENFCLTFPLFHQSAFVRSKILKKRLFNMEYKICADYESFYSFYISMKSFYYIPITISICECENGLSSRMSSQIQRLKEDAKIQGMSPISCRYIFQYINTIIRIIILSCFKKCNKKLYVSIYKWRCDKNKRMSVYNK